MSLLEQNITRKKWVDKNAAQLEFKGGDNEEYKVEWIRDSAVYAMELEAGHLLGLDYLVSWKSYLEEENIWRPVLAMQYFWKLLNKLYPENLTKPKATSSPVNFAPPMARPTIKSTGATKQKRGYQLRPALTKRLRKPKL